MLLPRVLKIQDDELLYGWYERILQENRIEGNKGEETRFFPDVFQPQGRCGNQGNDSIRLHTESGAALQPARSSQEVPKRGGTS